MEDNGGKQLRSQRAHMMDSHLFLSASLAGLMMMTAKRAGNFSEALFP